MRVRSVTALTVRVGSVAVEFRTGDEALRRALHGRYAGFIIDDGHPDYVFDIEAIVPSADRADADLSVVQDRTHWLVERGDFHARWDTQTRRGVIRQTSSPYATDSMLRILHTLVLAQEGGFLLHAASAVRDGRAFVFAGPSGAGKTTLSRLAPRGVSLLTDEVSYVRREGNVYVACGTPFAGDLGHPGVDVSAPIARLYLLTHGPGNRIEPLHGADRLRALLVNVLFFARDPALVHAVFAAAADFVDRVPVARLTFVPDAGVWDALAQEG